MNTLRKAVTLPLTTLGLLAACAGDGPTPPPKGVTISGSVRDVVGEPISGATVLVTGKNAVTSGSDGTFSIADVMIPYDLTAILNAQHAAVTYKGLTRSDPAVLDPYVTGPEHTATISGTAPPASGKVTVVHFASSVRYALGLGRADGTTGQYGFTVRWHGSYDTDAGRLELLRWTTDATGLLPVSYDGYASRSLTISAGANLSGNDFAAVDLTDPPEQSISGAIAIPATYTLNLRQLFIIFGHVGAYWEEKNPVSNAFTYTVPDLSGVAFDVAATAVDGASRSSSFFRRISGNASNVGILLPAASQLALPANGASAVDATTPFSWTQGEGAGVNLFKVWPDDAANPTYFVFTTGADAKIPDLAGEAMGLPAGASYHWHIDRLFPVASIDSAASEGFRRLIADLDGGDVGETLSERFGFTTKTAAGAAFAASAAGPTTAVAEGAGRRGLVMRAEAVPTGPR